MDKVALAFFPYPFIFGEHPAPGVFRNWPDECVKCGYECPRIPDLEIGVCGRGFNFCWLSGELKLGGIVLDKSGATTTAAHKKRLRQVGKGRVKIEEFDATLKRYVSRIEELARVVEDEKERVIHEYVAREQYKPDFLKRMAPEIKRNLSYIHDYRQFVAQVSQNMNVILEERFPSVTMAEKLRRASHSEAATYWATKLMDEKLKTASFLIEPEKITATSTFTKFRFHGMLTKIVKIYQNSFQKKNVNCRVVGESFGRIFGNAEAVGVIPHTFIDNACKYAPKGTEVLITVEDDRDQVRFSCRSYGPVIKREEKEGIFELFVRGEAAKEQEGQGMGYGLYLARFIARRLGTDIRVVQDQKDKKYGCFMTEFSVEFDMADIDERAI